MRDTNKVERESSICLAGDDVVFRKWDEVGQVILENGELLIFCWWLNAKIWKIVFKAVNTCRVQAHVYIWRV